MIDSHCHLTSITSDSQNLSHIIKKANQNSIKHIINISTGIKDFFKFTKILESYPNISFSFGIHPSNIDNKVESFSYNDIKKFLLKGKQKYGDRILAIGEVGLDYYRNYVSKELQKKFFDLQIDLANEFNLPLIIHTREAFDDTLEMLKKAEVPVLLHCYSGNQAITEKILKEHPNYYFSFAGNLTFKKAFDLKDSIKIIPINRIFFETDSPYLTPVPHRGKKNKPEYVKHTYSYGANLLDIDINELEKQVDNNVQKFFNKNLLRPNCWI